MTSFLSDQIFVFVRDVTKEKERGIFFLLQFRRKFESVSDPLSTSILLNVTFLFFLLLQLGVNPIKEIGTLAGH